MKSKMLLTLFLLITMLLVTSKTGIAQVPLIAHAGNDTIFCSYVDSVILGDFPSAQGGVLPYTYSWNMTPNPYYPYPSIPQYFYHTSDILNDSTLANPILLWLPHDQCITFILTITDNIGQIAIDSITLRKVEWTMALGQIAVETFPGDTQTISPTPFGGGIFPYTYDWGTEPGILGDQFDYYVGEDSIYRTRQVVIPNGPFPLIYSILVTDSAGCQIEVPSFEIFLNNFSVDETYLQKSLVFPNPVTNFLSIEMDGKEVSSISIIDMSGKAVDLSGKITISDKVRIDTHNLLPGAYNLQIETNDGVINRKFIKTIP